MSTVVEALRGVWLAQRALVIERVDAIEHALAELAEDRLAERERAEAQRAAHMLSGSLGTFGFTSASAAAGALDRALDRPLAADAATLIQLLDTLRKDVQDDD